LRSTAGRSSCRCSSASSSGRKSSQSKLIDSILKGFPHWHVHLLEDQGGVAQLQRGGQPQVAGDTIRATTCSTSLDGQQRITSLYAIRKGIRITKDGKEVDYRDVFINLDHDPENDEQIVVTERQDPASAMFRCTAC
jgi:hypothetical protein